MRLFLWVLGLTLGVIGLAAEAAETLAERMSR